jgi:hypothetical protein
MMKLAIVGDLSQQNPVMLAAALDAAMQASDVVVLVGDVNPGYDVVKARVPSGKLLVIPGNHDIQGPGNWDASLPGMPKQWRKDFPEATLIGLNNSVDVFDQEAWDLLDTYAANPRPVPLFLFFHKSLSPLILPDGTESKHIMGEGNPVPDAQKLIGWLSGREATVACGHFHGQSVVQTNYATILLEGRGGAAGPANIGYTLLFIQQDGWTAHPVSVPAPQGV